MQKVTSLKIDLKRFVTQSAIIITPVSFIFLPHLGHLPFIGFHFTSLSEPHSGHTTLENATIESSKCRYSVHDERDTDSDSYNNYYINCRMTHDNTNGGYNQCIGGGLGLDGHVIIDGCIFENPARTNYQIVYYHNSAGSGKSFVEVKGSYFKGTNTLGFQWYGSSPATQKSTLFAHGNSFGSAIQHTGASGATVENTEVISFSNEIRNE